MIFVYRRAGAGDRSRARATRGCTAARPVFATPRALALSYFDPYVDFTGRVTGYAVVDLRDVMGDYDWRLADTNVWKVERMLLDYPHRPIRSSDRRVERAARPLSRVQSAIPGRKPVFYRARDRWTPLPAEFCEG